MNRKQVLECTLDASKKPKNSPFVWGVRLLTKYWNYE